MIERHLAMLKRNQDIFEKYKTNEEMGLEIATDKQKEYSNFGRNFITLEKKEEFADIRSVHYHNILTKKLEEYSLPEWFICLKEGILLEYAIPIFSRVLQKYPMLCGMDSEWQVLYCITQVNSAFWAERETWKKYFKEIIDDILEEYEERKMKEVIPKEYLAKFYDFTDS